MSQAQVNPDELERFAQQLKQFNAELQGSKSRLSAQFTRLGDTWRDQQHQKFAQEFQQTMRIIDRFMQSSEQQIPLLQKKASIIRQYLNQR